MVNIPALIDDAKGFDTVRCLRWPDGVRGPECNAAEVIKTGRDDSQPERRRSEGRSGGRRGDDLTGTIVAGHHPPLRTWSLGLDFLGRNLSHEPIAQEWDLNPDAAQRMTTQRREGIGPRKPAVVLCGAVACDEVDVVAGHQGNPEAVRNKGARDAVGG